jgi:hypothetical protein
MLQASMAADGQREKQDCRHRWRLMVKERNKIAGIDGG